LNLCSGCGEDFGSLTTFDAHRVGKHAYTFREGLRMGPPVEDGRRCLDPDEMLELGWTKDRHGRWRGPAPESPVWGAGKRESAALSR
jgi:hypothetical protein